MTEHTLGDGPIEPKYLKKMESVARGLDDVFNGTLTGDKRRVGFVLLVFPFGDDTTGRCNYISNGADRMDVVALMKEMIARFEGQAEMEGKG